MEAACGVVRHFKDSSVAPFESMVNRGTRPALSTTSCVRSLPLLSLSACRSQPSARSRQPHPSTETPPHLCTAPSKLHLLPTFHCYFNCQGSPASDRRYQPDPSTASYHCQCSLRALQAGRGQGAECFYAFVNK